MLICDASSRAPLRLGWGTRVRLCRRGKGLATAPPAKHSGHRLERSAQAGVRCKMPRLSRALQGFRLTAAWRPKQAKQRHDRKPRALGAAAGARASGVSPHRECRPELDGRRRHRCLCVVAVARGLRIPSQSSPRHSVRFSMTSSQRWPPRARRPGRREAPRWRADGHRAQKRSGNCLAMPAAIASARTSMWPRIASQVFASAPYCLSLICWFCVA